MWRILTAENKILKYLQILAARKNQADWEILAFADKQADWKIFAFAKNQADDRIFVGIEIPAPGEKPAFEEKPASEEKPAGLEKQAACLLFRLGRISSCWFLPGLADDSYVSFSLSYGEKSKDLNLQTAHLRNLRICDCSSIKRNLRIWNFWIRISSNSNSNSNS